MNSNVTTSRDKLGEVQYLQIVIHASFIGVASIILIVMKYCTKLRYYDHKTLIRYPGHKFKWAISGLLLTVLFFSVADGILTDLTRNATSDPYLYIPQLLAVISVVLSLVYYHHMEHWNRPHLAWWMLLYWVMAIIGELLAILRLSEYLGGFNGTMMRLDISIVVIILYTCCVVAEINVLKTKNSPFVTIEEFFTNGFILVLVASISILMKAVLWAHSFGDSVDIGISLNSAIQNHVYEKTLRLSSQSTDELSVGQTVNHIAVDGAAVQWFFIYFGFMVCNPIQAIIVCVWLFNSMGISGVIGASIVVLAVPFLLGFGDMQGKSHRRSLIYSDERLEKTSEVLHGIKLLKLYAWEELFSTGIKSIRNKEMKQKQCVGLYFLLSRTLTIIVGKVGSGKSSLLSAILGEMYTITGSVKLYGYFTVLDVCALNPDLQILPGGDLTEIGERGINLSGGQKHRISLARALYSNTDIVILDDPLSSLDVHVSEYVMVNAIFGLLRDQQRTVILVTHMIQHLEHADQVLVMEDGQIVQNGNMKEIQKQDIRLYRQWQEMVSEISESQSERSKETTVTRIETSTSTSFDLQRHIN
uniref:ATP-binding cassette sub-family C member 9-like n=1 Tax=Saccoglossus kowalevskii TaxID=10224 RepID=A0ABM0LUU0_SACKO